MGKRREYGTIVQIGDVYVSEEVLTEYFACDYPVCRGACCIIGESGAPLREEELDPLERNYPSYAPLMTPSGQEAVSAKGFFEIDRDGDLVTPVVPGEPGREACAFCHFPGSGDCLCAIEKAFSEGKCSFPKPVSCRLYPIRVVRLGEGTVGLNLHRWDICKAAFEKGRREKVRVFEFLRDPLEETFGRDFYAALCEAARHLGR